MPITLISCAHHAIKQKLQKLPSWSKGPNNTSVKITEPNEEMAKKSTDTEPLSAPKQTLLGIKASLPEECIQMVSPMYRKLCNRCPKYIYNPFSNTFLLARVQKIKVM